MRALTETLVNGRQATSVPTDDRGLNYADGLFETMQCVRGALPWIDYHYERLASGCERLGLQPPSRSVIAHEASRVSAGLDDCIVKLVVTRGSGGRGYLPPQSARVRRIMSAHPMPVHPASWARRGVRVRVCQTPIAHNRLLAGLKHLARIEQVLARAEWRDRYVAEGLMLDPDGMVIEATAANVFAVRGGIVTTPRLDRAGVAGVMRRRVMEMSAVMQLPCKERRMPLEILLQADEVFLTNSIVGIWPVRRIETHHLKPGAVTRALQRACARAQSERGA